MLRNNHGSRSAAADYRERRHGGIQKDREQNRPTYFVSSSVSRELQFNRRVRRGEAEFFAEDLEDENKKVRAGRTY